MKAIRKDPSDFTMVTRGYWSDLRALSKRMPAAFQVLILITERMNKSNALVISQATLGRCLATVAPPFTRPQNYLKTRSGSRL